ncbi:response regulator transcription factor [Clostridiaceae bacterium M8S5]|nr:response regulator transcription factor [Clostridiaceae bacterium M8S5]
MDNNIITIMIADDHALMRQGLKQILELEDDIKVIEETKDGEETIQRCLEIKPDVVLLDINMPKLSGIEVLRRLKDIGIDTKIIMLTIHNDVEYLSETLNIGADGYVLKDAESSTLINAIRNVMGGSRFIQSSIANLLSQRYKNDDDGLAGNKKNLTKREYEVITLIAEGLNNKEIAKRLFISEKTVKNHVSNIFKKIEVTDRIQAAIFAYKNNIKKI